MIVLDASAAVLALLSDGDARQHLAVDSVAVPHLVDSEVAHSLRAHVHRGTLDASAGQQVIERWARLGIQRFSIAGLLERVWQLRENLTAYDATYVALAEALQCSLVTADARLARAPGLTCPVTVVRR